MTSTTHCTVNALCARAVRLFARVHRFFSQAMMTMSVRETDLDASHRHQMLNSSIYRRERPFSQLVGSNWIMTMENEITESSKRAYGIFQDLYPNLESFRCTLLRF